MDMNRNTIQRCPRIIANPLSRLRSALRLPHRRPPLAALPPLSTCQATHRATDVVVSAPSPFPLRPCHSRRIVPYIMRPPIRFVPPPGHRRQAPATCLSSPLHSQSRPLHFDVGSARYTAPPHRAPLPLHHRCHEADATAVRLSARPGLPMLGPPIADYRSSWSAATEVTSRATRMAAGRRNVNASSSSSHGM
ncbi:hypothetical protein PVAP13_3KG160527 [Panicum virgatum]|uniref:Uncharacterized protein n=1 Tax=Panicum virgatum TaxID=38727 RepID=A0A8T0UQN2_PANVG|nr:hypothetical protein PVAP13_3KG160527 [Panicum virgatum]KAG2625001.1 hypothetical protein PVAP13_3KG160527 [Panicum virgatum]KAG2625002.1 hypothetical protein PVAP13_3KG160527 [Panicum virgatum]KAG2625003.1 hypothetical protein PVAP13_3KG160527 [Panicum virgatum]